MGHRKQLLQKFFAHMDANELGMLVVCDKSGFAKVTEGFEDTERGRTQFGIFCTDRTIEASNEELEEFIVDMDRLSKALEYIRKKEEKKEQNAAKERASTGAGAAGMEDSSRVETTCSVEPALSDASLLVFGGISPY